MIVATMFAVVGWSVALASEPSYGTRIYPEKFATGLVKDAKALEFQHSAPWRSFGGALDAVPGSYSMRGKAGPVEYQGSCGSCWDFSLVSVLRGTQMMSGADPGRLSFNYLLNCATDQYGCSGGYFNAAAWLVAPKGAPAYGSDGYYTGSQGQCIPAPVKSSAVEYSMLGLFGTLPSFQDIAYVVGVLHRPVSVDVNADDSWMRYGWGTYNGCTNSSPFYTNHMVSIEGYDCETSVDAEGNCAFDLGGNLPPGVGTWIVRNSWGTGWGDGGYIRTKATDPKGGRCNAIASNALYFAVE